MAETEEKLIREGNAPIETAGTERNGPEVIIDEAELAEFVEKTRAEEVAARLFIDSARQDGELGRNAVAEMEGIAKKAKELRRGWATRIAHILANPRRELREYKARKRTESYAKLDNPKIWNEFWKKKKVIDKEIDALRKNQKKEERELKLSDNLLERIKNILVEYKSFNRSPRLSGPENDFGNQLAARFIKNLLYYQQVDKALGLWKLAPDGDYDTARTLVIGVSENFGKDYNTYKTEKRAEGIDEGQIIKLWRAEREEYFNKNLAHYPDLQAVLFRESPRFEQFGLDRSPEKQIEIIKALIALPERTFFLNTFSPFSDGLAQVMDTGLKKELFEACLQNNLQTAVENYDFFKQEFESLSPDQRNQIISQISERFKYLYASAGDRLIGSYYQANRFIFKFLEFTKITPEEQQKIFEAVTPGEHQFRYDKKKDWPALKEKYHQKTYNSLLADMWANSPQALILNGWVLTGYQEPNDQTSATPQDRLAASIIQHGERSALIHAFFDSVHPEYNEAPGPQFSEETALAFVQYLLTDGKAGIKTLGKKLGNVDALPMNQTLQQELVDVLLQNTPTGTLDYLLSHRKESSRIAFDGLTTAQKDVCLKKLLINEDDNLFVKFIPYFDELTQAQKDLFVDGALKKQNEKVLTSCIALFGKITPPQEEQFIDTMIYGEKSESFLPALLKTLGESAKVSESVLTKTRAVCAYIKCTGIPDQPTLVEYINRYIKDGQEMADAYIDGLKEKAKGLVGEKIPSVLRKLPEYQFIVKHVFPDGNYSTYEKNLACGDRLDHLTKYDYNKNGYSVELSGLLGYFLKEVPIEEGGQKVAQQDDIPLFRSYERRLQQINEFVGSRGPDNEALREAFDGKVSNLFDQYAAAEFRKISGMTPEEKMLVLFITEALRRDQKESFVPNNQILDLVIEYKYAYHENLAAYIQQSAHDVEQYQDEVSKRCLLWQELSTVYGENVKHVLRHNIFEKLSKTSKNYGKIVETFGEIISLPSESFELSQRELQSIEVIFKKNVSAEEKYTLLLEKLADLLGPQLKLKGVDDEKTQQQVQYNKERGDFVALLDSLLSSHAADLDAQKVGAVISQAFKLHPRQLKRFESTFDNEKIPKEDTLVEGKIREGKFQVLLKQVLNMFDSNIKFKDADERKNFKESVSAILEPIQKTLDKEEFFALIPKLRTLRNQYRFGINSKLEELFTLDLNAINRELAKFEEIIEVENKESRIGGPKEKEVKKSAKKRKIRTFISKTRETANARMGAYLCLAGDEKMWNNKNYFEGVDMDEDTGKCVGLTMFLDIPAKEDKKYLWMGPNPFESFMTQVSATQAFEHQYAVAIDVAKKNGFDGIVIPPEDGQILGACTNRGGNFPKLIRAKRLKDKEGRLEIVDFGKEHILGHYNSTPYKYSSGALIWKRPTA